jgi:pyruvate ferredoxin oxidoreductase gamma subunit
VPATKIASKVGGTELSANIAMLGALLGITALVDMGCFEKAMTERFSSKKFVASGTTAALDDAVKGRYAQTSQLIENNMNVVKAAAQSIRRYTFDEEARYA